VDLQAQDRVHRIGQTRPVLVYRLCIANSLEAKMLEKANDKRRLEKLVIHHRKFKRIDQDLELQALASSLAPGASSSTTAAATSPPSKSSGLLPAVTSATELAALQLSELQEILTSHDGEAIDFSSHKDAVISDADLERILDRSDLGMALSPFFFFYFFFLKYSSGPKRPWERKKNFFFWSRDLLCWLALSCSLCMPKREILLLCLRLRSNPSSSVSLCAQPLRACPRARASRCLRPRPRTSWTATPPATWNEALRFSSVRGRVQEREKHFVFLFYFYFIFF
jgi:hypothetical protein